MKEINLLLMSASIMTFIAGILHLACIAFGASWYRFFGAGKSMLQLVESGSTYPTKITSLIAVMLFILSAYALSGAGAILALPFLRPVLVLITALFLVRGLGFYFLMRIIRGNSLRFWLYSSAICLILGLVYLFGLIQIWNTL